MKGIEDMHNGEVDLSKEEPPTNLQGCGSPVPQNSKDSLDSNWTQRRILKNLFLISAGILLLMSSYEGLISLQSTMNSSGGIGVYSEATVYAFFCVSSLTLPKYVIRTLGCKRSVVLGMMSYFLFISLNFYPHWGTLIPSAVILGLGASILWAASSCYINELSFQQSLCSGDSLDAINAKFFGVSGMFYMASYAFGNLLSCVILRGPFVDVATLQMNDTSIVCGADFCGTDEQNPNLHEPSQAERYLLTTAFLTCCLVSTLLVMLSLDNVPRDKEMEKAAHLSVSVFMSTLKLMKHPNQILMMPMAFYLGISEGFYFTDITRAYIACAWGVYHIGHVSICYGVWCAVSSSLSGILVKYVGRIPIFLSAAAINMVAIWQIFCWTAESLNPTMFFVLAGMWGVFVGVFRSQIMALYGLLFYEDEEAAFANYHLWNGLGFCASFSYSNYLCTITKIYVVGVIFCISTLGYILLELKIIWAKKTYTVRAK